MIESLHVTHKKDKDTAWNENEERQSPQKDRTFLILADDTFGVVVLVTLCCAVL